MCVCVCVKHRELLNYLKKIVRDTLIAAKLTYWVYNYSQITGWNLKNRACVVSKTEQLKIDCLFCIETIWIPECHWNWNRNPNGNKWLFLHHFMQNESTIIKVNIISMQKKMFQIGNLIACTNSISGLF